MTKVPPAVQAWGTALHVVDVNCRVGTVMAFSPDSRLLAVIGAYLQRGDWFSDDVIHVIDTSSGVLQAKFHADDIIYLSLAFNSSGMLLLTTSMSIKIWDIAGGTAPETLEDFSAFAREDRPWNKDYQKPIFSSDGQFLVWICTDGKLQLWNVLSRTLGHKLSYPESKMVTMQGSHYRTRISFSSDNSFVVLAVSSGSVWLWDVQTGHLIRTLSLPLSNSGISWTPNRDVFSCGASILFRAGHDVLMYSLSTGELYQKLDSGSRSATSTALSPDNLSVAVGVGEKIYLFNSTTGEHCNTRCGHWRDVETLLFSPDGRLLASASIDTTMRVWNIQATHHTELESDRDFTPKLISPRRVIISGNAQVVAFVGFESVELWEVSSGAFLRKIDFSSWELELGEVSFSPDGSLLVHTDTLESSSSEDGNDSGEYYQRQESMVRIWDLSTDTSPLRYNHYFSDYYDDSEGDVSMIFSPDSQLLAYNCGLDSIHLINVKTQAWWKIELDEGKNLRPRPQMAFSPDSQLLASPHQDGAVKVWHVKTGTLSHSLSDHCEQFKALAFSPSSNRYLATIATDPDSGYEETVVVLWDLSQDPILRHNFPGHEHITYAAAISSDERLLVSVCKDIYNIRLSILRLWDIAGGFLLHEWTAPRHRLQGLRFSADDSFIYSTKDYFKLKLDPDSGLYSTSVAISVDDCWLRLDGVKSLLFPVEFEVFSYEIQGNVLAIGHPNGRVSTIEFAV